MKSYLYIGIIILLAVFIGWVYNLWQDYQTLKYQHQMSVQNAQAWKDSSLAKAAKISDLAVTIRTLTDEKKDLDQERIVLLGKNRILLDSLRFAGRADSAVFEDSTIRITFSGKQNFASFNGYTFTNIKTHVGTWGLVIDFDDIEVNTSLYQDTDGIWRFRSQSMTEGATILTHTILDEQTYSALQKYGPPERHKSFGLNLQANPADIWGGAIIRFNNQWYLNANYRLTNSQTNWSDNLLIGLSLFVF